MRVVEKSGMILAKHITPDDWNDGLGFFSENSDFIQVGTWNYNQGMDLLAHVHNRVERTVERTNEVLYIVSGSISATIYTLEGELVDVFPVKAGDILILLDSAHGYKVLEDHTRVLEVKNGPYLGAEVDRTRL